MSELAAKPVSASKFRPLRVWPAVVLVIAMWGLRMLPQVVSEVSMSVMMAAFMGPMACAGLIMLWWVAFSRAHWLERLIGIIALVVMILVTGTLADKTMQGIGTMVYGVPWGLTGFAGTLIGLRLLGSSTRTWVALFVALLCMGFWDLVRTDEFRGDFATRRSWRWEPTAEDKFLASLADAPPSGEYDSESEEPVGTDADEPDPVAAALLAPEWPEFRGPNRDGVQPDVVLGEDWQANPPRKLWRVPVGPGWSSFAVAGKRIFTQEQRGPHEVVVCYNADNGQQIWIHEDSTRFWETIGGAGPRGTPTLSGGKLYALGANGLLNRLDPLTGESEWQRDVNADAGRKPPTWGYSSSPLVTGSLVMVHAGGADDKGMFAYDAETGEPIWSSPSGDHTYSSPQLADIGGSPCVLMLSNKELSFVHPVKGTVLGSYEYPVDPYRVVQPLVIDGSRVLIGNPMGGGTREIKVRRNGEQVVIEDGWQARISPYYNDYVAHKGHLYGFDNNIFACIDLATGKRKWKRGRYGNGQVVLLPKQDQLLVISEDGELVLLKADPEKRNELGRHRVLDGRTWNHPVVVGNRVYVRNAEQAACFELPTK